jgi:hypothetical protein
MSQSCRARASRPGTAVLLHALVLGADHGPFGKSLRDEHSVKRVAVASHRKLT